MSFYLIQLVTERLQSAESKLPEEIETRQIAPISSPIGTSVNTQKAGVASQ
jgi:Cu/Ag efflux pump CusA